MQHRVHSVAGVALIISITAAAGASQFDGSSSTPATPSTITTVVAAPTTSASPTTTAAPAPTSSAAATPTTVQAVEPLVVPAAPVVVFYGDSLGWEASAQLVQQFALYPNVRVVTHTFGGTAICDWLDQMRADVADLQPWVGIVQFSGNALTPCMADVAGDQMAYLDRYRADAETAVGILAESAARVFLVGAPMSRDASTNPDYRGGALNTLYERLSSEVVHYVDAGSAVLDEGRWTDRLPCLPNEPCTGGVDADGHGFNVVRAPDGGHFCPTGDDAIDGVTSTCAVWSSGAYRFAAAIAAPVLAMLGPGLLG